MRKTFLSFCRLFRPGDLSDPGTLNELDSPPCAHLESATKTWGRARVSCESLGFMGHTPYKRVITLAFVVVTYTKPAMQILSTAII